MYARRARDVDAFVLFCFLRRDGIRRRRISCGGWCRLLFRKYETLHWTIRCERECRIYSNSHYGKCIRTHKTIQFSPIAAIYTCKFTGELDFSVIYSAIFTGKICRLSHTAGRRKEINCVVVASMEFRLELFSLTDGCLFVSLVLCVDLRRWETRAAVNFGAFSPATMISDSAVMTSI